MMKRYLTARVLMAVGIILSATTMYAQNEAKNIFNPVYTGVTSLSIAPDSRAGSMGDVGCATDPYLDNNSQYWCGYLSAGASSIGLFCTIFPIIIPRNE